MGILQKYANSSEVEEALDKGVQGYDKAAKNETDISLLKERVEKLENLPLAEDGEF